MPKSDHRIERWGDSLGLRLPAAVVRGARLHEGQRVRISVEGDRIVMSPFAECHPSLEQRLAAYDPARHGGEQMAATTISGAERRP